MTVVWDESGVAVYFFPRQSIPTDITGLAPQPQTWGIPFARWPASMCNPFQVRLSFFHIVTSPSLTHHAYQFFQQHWAIFDTTLWCVILKFVFIFSLVSIVVATGLETYGQQLGRLVRNRAVLSELDLLLAPISSRTAVHPSHKHVSREPLPLLYVAMFIFILS